MVWVGCFRDKLTIFGSSNPHHRITSHRICQNSHKTIVLGQELNETKRVKRSRYSVKLRSHLHVDGHFYTWSIRRSLKVCNLRGGMAFEKL